MTIRTEERVSHPEGAYARLAAKSEISESENRVTQRISEERIERMKFKRRMMQLIAEAEERAKQRITEARK